MVSLLLPRMTSDFPDRCSKALQRCNVHCMIDIFFHVLHEEKNPVIKEHSRFAKHLSNILVMKSSSRPSDFLKDPEKYRIQKCLNRWLVDNYHVNLTPQ